ncbi:heterokaryon incompatibility protein-domain-containing protein [Cercophora samala]|uniref:Heterokaryon incompatibility protein-domain-containing protein n=1 Tax=Cercophora samala TaxID=330535 RepID=A0AA39Z9W5_9PEZI|nr:heterokaryon incompatibility protein-domain-containing protein [Cercophora samala]
MSASTCEVCFGLNTSDTDRISFEIEDLTRSVKDGCASCILLWKALEHAIPNLSGEDGRVDLLQDDGQPLEVIYLDHEGSRKLLDIYCHADCPTSYSWIGPSTEVSIDSSSDDCFALAESWINDCINTHEICREEGAKPQLLPTRVIDIGTAEQPLRLRLHIPQNESARYVALSHCWGPPEKAAKTIKMTADTLHEFQTEIPWNKLSKTFKDAVTITRRLGIRYLWIDSLCIIQGDAQDWAVEASKMTTVYSDAFFVVAASGAADGDGGCFLGSRAASSEGVLSIECSGQQGGKSTAYARRTRRSYADSRRMTRAAQSLHGWMTGIGQPLETRAWTYQEEKLARRILYYTQDELQWRCGTCNACECSPPSSTILASDLSSTQDEKNEVWCRMVLAYTQRELTYISDRLPALSGIATGWELSEKDTFCAGLWRRGLPQQLLWMRSHEFDTSIPVSCSKRHPEFYAPTWSWASITGAVDFILDRLDFHARIVECETEPSTANRFGPVRSGHVTLIGFLVPVKATMNWHCKSRWSKKMPRVTDNRPGRNNQYLGDMLPDIETETREYPEIDGKECYHLFSVGHNGGVDTSISIKSLVLRQVQSTPNTYTRVGLLEVALDGTLEGFFSDTQETKIAII